MAIETAIATGLTPLSTGTISYEVAGFGTPQAAIVICARAASGFNPNGRSGLSTGFTDGTTHHVTGFAADDGAATTNTYRSSTTSLVRLTTGSGSTSTSGNFDSWATNGLTIDYTTVSGVQWHLTVLLIKGCDSVKSFAEQLPTTGVNDITSIGFKPNLVYLSSVGSTSIAGAAFTIYGLGAAHNNSSDVVSQGFLGFSSIDASATEVASVVTRDDSCIGQLHNEAQTWKGSAQDFDANGFSINTGGDVPGNDYIFGLALDTGNTDGVDISIIDSPTSTGTLNVTDPAFEPQSAMLLMGTGATTNTINTADPMAMGIGVFDGTTETCTGVDVDDAATTTDTQSNYATKAVQLYEFGGSTHDIMFEGTLTAFDSLGYDLSFPTYVDGTARKWLSIAIEGAAAPPTGAVMNQLQGSNMGADLFNGTLL